MANHPGTRHSPPTPFNCQAQALELLHCKHCNFRTDLTLIMKQHIAELHSRQPASPQTTSNAIQIYRCEKCDFETYFCISWWQHENECVGDGHTQAKSTTECVEDGDIQATSTTKCASSSAMSGRICEEDSLQIMKKEKYKIPLREPIVYTEEYKCDKCLYKTKFPEMLWIHMNRYHALDSKMYKCDHCTYKYSQMEYLEQHIRRTHPSFVPTMDSYERITTTSNPKCLTPSDEYNSSKSPKNDTNCSDQLVELHICKRCLYVCTKKEDLRKHCRIAHPKEADDNASDTIHRQSLEFHSYHKPSSEKVDNVQYKCGFCEFKTSNVKSLFLHKICEHQRRVHILDRVNKTKWHRCTHCSYKTEKESLMREHMLNSHSNEGKVTWFKCSHCPYKTRTDFAGLKQHVRNCH